MQINYGSFVIDRSEVFFGGLTFGDTVGYYQNGAYYPALVQNLYPLTIKIQNKTKKVDINELSWIKIGIQLQGSIMYKFIDFKSIIKVFGEDPINVDRVIKFTSVNQTENSILLLEVLT